MNINFADGSWRAIESWAQTRLKQEREKNDNAALDPAETALVRGRIALLKELLALPRLAAAQAQQRDPDD